MAETEEVIKMRGTHRVKTLPVKYADIVEKFPNFSRTGSVLGMREKYYGKDALLVRCGSYIYNVSSAPSIYYDLAY